MAYIKTLVFTGTVYFLFSASIMAQTYYTCDHDSRVNNEIYNEYFHNRPNMEIRTPVIIPVVIQQFSDHDSLLVAQLIPNLNVSFADAGVPIQFELCKIIDHDTLVSVASNLRDFCNENNFPDAMNIFVLERAGSSGAAAAQATGTLKGWVATQFFVPEVIAHETGHFFGLFHTHMTSFGAELVDGSNCASAGDRICDTPADPNLSNGVSTICSYTGNETDANGQAYVPDTLNYMSYTRLSCMSTFSEEQIDRMMDIYDTYYSDFSCSNSNTRNQLNHTARHVVFPNPTHDHLFINAENKNSLSEYSFVQIYDLSGKMVEVKSLKQSQLNELDVSNLNSGVYLLRIFSETYVDLHRIFIK